MSGKIITLRGHLLQTAKDFMADNHVNPEEWIYDYNGEERDDYYQAFRFTADVNKPEDPEGLCLELTDYDRITLPAGRMVDFAHNAGVITDMSSLMPLAPVPFDEAIRLAKEITARFEDAGYETIWGKDNKNWWYHNPDIAEKIVKDVSSTHYFSKWRHPHLPARYYFSIDAYSSFAGIASPSPVALSGPRSAVAKKTFLLNFGARVDFEVDDEVDQLLYARRLALTGSKDKYIPVKLWFDNPDWRPEGWNGKYIR